MNSFLNYKDSIENIKSNSTPVQIGEQIDNLTVTAKHAYFEELNEDLLPGASTQTLLSGATLAYPGLIGDDKTLNNYYTYTSFPLKLRTQLEFEFNLAGSPARTIRITDPYAGIWQSPTAPQIIYPQGSNIAGDTLLIKWIQAGSGVVNGYSFILDQTAATIPDDISEGLMTETTFINLEAGTYYFHIKQDNDGISWSATAHFQVNIVRNIINVDDFDDEVFGYNALPPPGPGSLGTFEIAGGTCALTHINDANRFGDAGYSLKIDYNVSVPGQNAGYYTSMAQVIQAGAYNTISFYVKGAAGGEVFEVGLKNSEEKKINIIHFTTITTNWQKVSLPIALFNTLTSADIDNFSLTFAEGMDPSGTIFIDNIQFEKMGSTAKIDSFNLG
ncbi:MAG: hypothetical protein Q8R48_02435, partial [Candidatus Omnitrophota bacterium]|nr:hypothetical protein [Candidatus Omnitrophota bacterium]